MVFSSGIFLFLFLPLFLAAYYLTPWRWKSLTILIGSYVFYAWWRVDFLLLFAGVTLWNHILAKLILHYDGQMAGRRWMQVGVLGNLLTLGVFKYFNFGVDSLNAILDASGQSSFESMRFILPIGISFYIFQSISFLIDVYRKDAPPARNFWDFAAFISLFPQLIAGPVLRYKDLAHQFEKREHSMDLFSEGAFRFMVGFSKKVLIADTIAPLVDMTFALENPSLADAWLGAIAYTVQLYFDFSGYSSMAIGLGLMMGFRFVENFNHPYISRSITEFWRRWHISLSSWLRDYLYIPLGGNRKGKIRTYVNLLLTMLLGGLWHGANWTYVLWGGWHGLWLAVERALGIKSSENDGTSRVVRGGQIAFTTLFAVIPAWVMFRAESVSKAFAFYEGMLGLNGIVLTEEISWKVTSTRIVALALGIFVIYAQPFVESLFRSSPSGINRFEYWGRQGVLAQGLLIVLFLMAVTKLSAESYSPFLYFQF